MNNIPQLMMLAVGGFVLWQWYSSRQTENGGGGSTTLPGGGSTGTGTQTGGQTGGSTGTGTQTGGQTGGSTENGNGNGNGNGGNGGGSTAPQLTVAQITPLAAGGNREWAAVLDERGIRYNVDQWNYYREQGGLPAIAPEDMEILILPEEDRQQTLLATEYLTRLERLNVGLGRIRRRRSVWET